MLVVQYRNKLKSNFKNLKMTISFIILFIFKILVMRIILISRIYKKITLFFINYPWFISLVSFIIITIFKTTTVSCFYDPEILRDFEEKVNIIYN
jgi:hypothetical protein